MTGYSMLPGDSSGPRTLVVANGGSGSLRYAMHASATDPDGKHLAARLHLVIRAGARVLYDGALADAVIGSPAPGGQPGDRVLAAGASETLTYEVDLPIGAGNDVQAASTVVAFVFDAEQTANNP